MNNLQPDFKYKVLVLGDHLSGKTNLISVLKCNSFFETEALRGTGAIDFVNYDNQLIVNSKKINLKMQLFDFYSRASRPFPLQCQYYRGTDGILLTYDVTNFDSFNNIHNWISWIREKLFNVVIILVGCKSDLDSSRKVLYEEGERLATQYNIPFFETSAKLRKNIKEPFNHLSKLIYEQKSSNSPNLDSQNQQKSTITKAIDRSIFLIIIFIIAPTTNFINN